MKASSKLVVAALVALLAVVLAAVGCGGKTPYSPLAKDTNGFFATAPDPDPAEPGASVTLPVTITLREGVLVGRPTTLSLANLPQGVTGTFSPNPVTPDADGVQTTLTLVLPPNITPGAYPFTIIADDGEGRQELIRTLDLTQTTSFTVNATDPAPVRPGEFVDLPVTVTEIDFEEDRGPRDVELSATGLPAGVTVAFTPASVNADRDGTVSTMRLTVEGTVAEGTYPFQIVGDDGLETKSISRNLTVEDPTTFTLTAPAPSPVTPGSTTTIGITVTEVLLEDQSKGPHDVELSVTGLPDGVTGGFDPETVRATRDGVLSTLTLQVGGGVAPGDYPFNVVGNDGETSRTLGLTLTVSPISGDGFLVYTQLAADEEAHLYRIAPDGSGKASIAELPMAGLTRGLGGEIPSHPSVANDTGDVFFTLDSGEGDRAIFRVGLEGGTAEWVFNSNLTSQIPEFEVNSDATIGLFRNSDGGVSSFDLLQMMDSLIGTGTEFGPSWSANDQVIAYGSQDESFEEGEFSTSVYRWYYDLPGGGEPIHIDAIPDYDYVSPLYMTTALDSNGSTLAYTYYDNFTGLSQLEYISDNDGDSLTAIPKVNSGAHQLFPTFSPNNDKLAYVEAWQMSGILFSQVYIYDFVNQESVAVPNTLITVSVLTLNREIPLDPILITGLDWTNAVLDQD